MKNNYMTISSMLIVLIACVSFPFVCHGQQFGGGSGTAGDPWLIATPIHLDSIRYFTGSSHADKHFRQVADINLNIAPWNTGSGWNPMGGYFMGTYDGSGYKIDSLFINRGSTDGAGLFKWTDQAVIRNVILTNVNVRARDDVGALVGYAQESIIEQCYSSGTVSGRSYIGGLIGITYGIDLSQSASSANITSTSYSGGGLVGWTEESNITNCYATGNVSGSNQAGGLAATIDYWDNVSKIPYTAFCYSTGTVSGTIDVGGFVGRHIEGARTEYNYWNIETSGIDSSQAGVGLTTDGMSNIETFALSGWDFKGLGPNGVWNIGNNRNNGFPYLSWQYPNDPPYSNPILPYAITLNPTIIKHQSAVMNGIVSNKGIPTATQHGFCWNTTGLPTTSDSKIELGAVALGDFSVPVSTLTPNTKYYLRTYITNSIGVKYGNQIEFHTLPIDTIRPQGSGTELDPYLISSLTNLTWIALSPDQWKKHYLQTADIDASETATWYEGAGWIPIGDIQWGKWFDGIYEGNGHVIIGLTINRPDMDYVGLFRKMQNTSINLRISNLGLLDANITGRKNVGTIIGYMLNHYDGIMRCYSSGSVTGIENVGGIAGSASANFRTCYSTANVTGLIYVGGIVGGLGNHRVASNCYSTGTISGISNIGGIAGAIHGSVTYSYSTSLVSGDSYVGGVVGRINYGGVTNSFWNLESSAIDSSAGGTGRLTHQMLNQSNYASWDFTDIWAISEGNSYPYHKQQGEAMEHNYPPYFEVTLSAHPDSVASQANLVGAGQHRAGYSVSISTGNVEGFHFKEWTSSDEVLAHIDDPSAMATSFLMPYANAEVAAVYREMPFDVWVSPSYNPSTPGWGRTHFNTIQEGVDSVAYRGKVHVGDGTYYEDIVIGSAITVMHSSIIFTPASEAKIVGVDLGSGAVIDIQAPGVTVAGLTIATEGDSDDATGIKLSHSAEGCTIRGNNISGCSIGIAIASPDNEIHLNRIEENAKGIALIDTFSVGNIVHTNTLDNNNIGIALSNHSSGNTIFNNSFSNKTNATDASEGNSWSVERIPADNILGGPFIAGNYWDCYRGEDTDCDGIGNTLLPHSSEDDILNGGDAMPIVPLASPHLTLLIEPSNLSPVFTGEGCHNLGSLVNISVGNIASYRFTSWAGSTIDVALLDNPASQATSLTMPNRNVRLTANMVRVFNLSIGVDPRHISASSNPTGNGLYTEGSRVCISANDVEGYTFAGWVGDSVDVALLENSSSLSTCLYMPNRGVSLTAKYNQIPENFTLTVSVEGNGTVKVDGTLYNEPIIVMEGTVLELEAIAVAGWQLAGWSGSEAEPFDATETTTSITMDADKAITATFTEIPLPEYTLTIAVVGQGTTTPAAGNHTYTEVSVVELFASPSQGYEFSKWVIGTEEVLTQSVSLTVSSDTIATAHFVETTATQYTLTVAKVGSGSVIPPIGEHIYNEGAEVALVATPADGWTFQKWEIDGEVTTENPTIQTITADMAATAHFVEQGVTPPTYTLTLTVVGNGSVLVNGTAYSAPIAVEEGITLELDATADTGWQFDGWSGHATGTSTTLSVTMDGDKTIAATFSPISSAITLALGDVTAYPNPFANTLTLSGVQGVSRVVVTNLLGARVMDISLNGQEQAILHTGELPRSMYLVTLTDTQGNRSVLRLVKK